MLNIGKYWIQIFSIIGLVLGMGSAWADGQPAKLDSVTLQLKWKHQFQFAGYYAAKEKGFYKEAGLDVNIVEATPGLDVAQEVISGRAQYGVGTSELILNRNRGNPVVVLGVIFQHSPLVLITLKESGIDNIHKLVGRKVMIEPASAELFAYLYQEGFTKKAFDLQSHTMDIDELLSGKVDAMSTYLTSDPYLLKKQGRAYIQFSPLMSGIDFYGDNFFTVESEVNQHPQRVKAFREATLRGWRYAMQNPDEIIQLIYKNYSQHRSIEHLQFEAKTMRDLMQPELIDPGYMNIGRWEHIANTYHELALLPERFDVAPMLYFPDPAVDVEKLKSKLYYAAAGLMLVALLSVILFRFYRRARINEARLKVMFDNAPLGIIVLDEKNRVQSWNAEAEKTFLWRAEDILGKNVLIIVPPAERMEVEKVLSTVHIDHAAVHHENANIKKDGTEIICEWMNAPFQDEHNQSSYIVCMARDITERKLLAQKLERSAHFDALTGLPNRALILERLKQSLNMAARQKTKLAILFLDLNGFKAINDSLGHEAGDLLLQMVAQGLPNAIRETDHVGRLGGDEFLVVLQDIGSRANAQRLANKLHDVICRPYEIKGQVVEVGTSIGISLYPDDATEKHELIHHADQGMYQAKQARRAQKQLEHE